MNLASHVQYGYCSQQGCSSSFQNIEKGMKFIESLLQKKMLCRHDVTDLRQAYQMMNNLGKKNILFQIIQKIDCIRHEVLAEQIITAYHLKQLNIPRIDQAFSSLFNPSNLTLDHIKNIATHLPLCESEQIFDADVEALIGSAYSADIAALLKVKKEQFYQYISYHQELKQLREKSPSLHPSYMEEILNGRFFHLYNHLMAMKMLPDKVKKEAAIQKLSFDSFAKIILEFREAVLIKIERMIPQERGNIVFLLGNTRSGKSTTFCYLRKDLMVLDGTSYLSSNDQDNLIGHKSDISCTLFPNVAISSNQIFVDFPGFTDTHGQVISLAIEITLKALVRKYSPQILLLMSIKDTESGGANIHRLGNRLKRVLGTLDHCTLGLTKYSKHHDFMRIQEIEKKEKEELSCPDKEELKLQTEISFLSTLIEKYPNLDEEIKNLHQKEQELAKLQQVRLSLFVDTLPDTKEKLEHRKNLANQEEAFKNQIGIHRLIPFAQLTNPIQRDKILEMLSVKKITYSTQTNQELNGNNSLDAEDKELIQTLFNNDLIHIIKSREGPSLPSSIVFNIHTDSSEKAFLKNVEDFEQRILETSLINTILSRSYPEIGIFFHLEEMDPSLIRDYDKKVIKDCIDGYIQDVVSGLLVAEDVIKELKSQYSKQQNQEIDREWASLKSYILIVSKGISKHAPPDKVKEAWESLQKEHQLRLKGTEKGLELPGWLKAILLIPLGIPFGIFSIFKKIKLDQASKDLIEGSTQNLHQKIKAAAQVVISLIDIENTVSKKDQFDKIFSSSPLSLDSLSSLENSLKNQIIGVKNIYGAAEWKERVAFIIDQLRLKFSSMRSGYPLRETLLYALISQTLAWEKLPLYFDKFTSLALIYSFINSQKNYEEVLYKLIPTRQEFSYQDLKSPQFSSFSHPFSITKEEYSFLRDQGQKLFEASHKTLISRLLLVDAINHLENTGEASLSPLASSQQIKIMKTLEDKELMLESNKEQLRDNRSFILSAVKLNKKAFNFATHSLKTNKEFVLAVMKENGQALEYVSEAFKNDLEVVLAAVQQNKLALAYASESLKQNQEVLLATIREIS